MAAAVTSLSAEVGVRSLNRLLQRDDASGVRYFHKVVFRQRIVELSSGGGAGAGGGGRGKGAAGGGGRPFSPKTLEPDDTAVLYCCMLEDGVAFVDTTSTVIQ